MVSRFYKTPRAAPTKVAGTSGRKESPVKRLDATFAVTRWEEPPWHEREGEPKLTRASVGKSYRGGIEGEGEVEFLLVHRPDGTAEFTGLERVRGTVDGRPGTFVLRHEGTFAGGRVDSTWTVVAGSGTGGLAGLRGTAAFVHGHAEEYPVTLECAFGG